MQTIFLGSDHGGYQLKLLIKKFIQEKYPDQYKFEEMGCNSDESCDYPIFGKAVATEVVKDKENLGIIICGSGIGISIAANRVTGARAALANSVELATLGRQHNGANILALGERTQFIDPWEDIVTAFLETEVDTADRHQRRRRLLDKKEITFT